MNAQRSSQLNVFDRLRCVRDLCGLCPVAQLAVSTKMEKVADFRLLYRTSRTHTGHAGFFAGEAVCYDVQIVWRWALADDARSASRASACAIFDRRANKKWVRQRFCQSHHESKVRFSKHVAISRRTVMSLYYRCVNITKRWSRITSIKSRSIRDNFELAFARGTILLAKGDLIESGALHISGPSTHA